MYADDAVIFTHAKTVQEASQSLTSALSRVQEWLIKSCLLLNPKKTVCMMFSKRQINMTRSNIFLNREELQIVYEFKYLALY